MGCDLLRLKNLIETGDGERVFVNEKKKTNETKQKTQSREGRAKSGE